MALAGYNAFAFDHDGATRTVYCRGQGPGVVIIHEVPGITPAVERFANFVVDAGFTAFLPQLFGTPGRSESVSYIARGMLSACVRSEFAVLARREASPITDWLRARCRRAHAECGGPGVGAFGMCLTGNFALSLMVDECVMAPVLSQPSLPFSVSASHSAALHLSDADLAVVKERAATGCGVLGLRFTHDVLCPAARFDTLRRELGEGFEGIEIDSGPGNPHGIPRIAHSVVTKDLVDEAGHPTRQALDRVLAVFRERLQVV